MRLCCISPNLPCTVTFQLDLDLLRLEFAFAWNSLVRSRASYQKFNKALPVQSFAFRYPTFLPDIHKVQLLLLT